MPDKKISQLTEVTTPDSTDALVLARTGANKRLSWSSLITNVLASFTRVTTFMGRSGAVTMQSSDLNGLNGSGLSGIGAGTGGVINTGTTTIGADSDSDGVGVIAWQTRATTRGGVTNDGAFEYIGQSAPALSASGKARAYFDSTSKKLMLSQDAGAYAPLGSLGLAINVTSPAYGAFGDGSHDDAAAIQAAQNAIQTIGGELLFPPGTYLVSVAINIIEAKSIRWSGCGSDKTKIVATGGQTAVQVNGLWRSLFQGIYFTTNATISGAAVFELDGHYDGTHTQGVQGNTFLGCYFQGNQLAPYAFALCRRGTSNGQGSENSFLNNNFDGGTLACYYHDGYNALNNVFLGGNFQSYPKFGISIVAGSVKVFGVAFQSTFGYAQIANGGADIDASSAGVVERIVVEGCDSESLVFYHGSGSQPGVLIGNLTRHGTAYFWTASAAVTVGISLVKQDPSGINRLYRVTTAGTSGGSQPTWPASGTVTDGSAVWTLTEFNVVDSNDGPILLMGNMWGVGNVRAGSGAGALANTDNMLLLAANTREVSSNVTASNDDELLLVDATSGDRVITLPFSGSVRPQPPAGKKYRIKKYDTTSHTVTVQDDAGSGPDGAAQVIPGGSRGYLDVEMCGGANLTRRYWITSKSF